MAVKKLDIPGIGSVTLVRNRQNKKLRLSLSGDGVRVSMPYYTPFKVGSSFAEANRAWIMHERAKQQQSPLLQGQRIGKMHTLRFEQILDNRSIGSRISGSEVIVRMLSSDSTNDAAVQKLAHQASERCLRREAQLLLPPRLKAIAEAAGLEYGTISVKSLKRRWGSCDSHRNIIFNLHLMDLSWQEIDYVIKHELSHTRHMDHGVDFWNLLTQLEPDARTISKRLRSRQPGTAGAD